MLLGVLYDKIKKSGAIPIRTMRIGLVITLLLLVLQYEVMNPPGFLRKGPDCSDKETGEMFHSKADKDEVIFTNSEAIEPQVIYYAQRNIRWAKDTAEAREFLAKTNRLKGVFIEPKTAGTSSVSKELHFSR